MTPTSEFGAPQPPEPPQAAQNSSDPLLADVDGSLLASPAPIARCSVPSAAVGSRKSSPQAPNQPAVAPIPVLAFSVPMQTTACTFKAGVAPRATTRAVRRAPVTCVALSIKECAKGAAVAAASLALVLVSVGKGSAAQGPGERAGLPAAALVRAEQVQQALLEYRAGNLCWASSLCSYAPGAMRHP